MLTLSRIVPERRERGATVSAVSTAYASGSDLLVVAGAGTAGISGDDAILLDGDKARHG